MLRELHISNLAVIADARVELGAGLNCFTGATGAGKSLVIGAIEVLLGLRSPSEMLRKGADEGRVSGVFEIASTPLLQQIDRIADTSVASDGGELLLTRRLYASGRSSVSLNGHPITLAMLKEIGEALVDVHGQHDHQFLLKPANQLDVLDQYAGTLELRSRYHATYTQLADAKHRLHALKTGQSLRKQQIEFYRFQLDEIEAANLSQAEFDELQARASVLGNLEKIKKDAGATYSALYEADGAVLERLKMMSVVLAELAMLDQSLTPLTQTVRDATLQLEDASFELGRYIDRLDLDPSELAEVHDRLNQLHRLLNKYAGDVAGTLAYRDEIAGKLETLEREGADTSSLEKQIAPLEKQLQQLGLELRAARQRAAGTLAGLIERQLADLGMDKARFTIELRPAEPAPSGLDQVEFIGQTNPGLAAQPLRKIASGGELSRIMLALKGVLASGDRVSVLVFDEIDSNVGGRLGAIIGEKLRRLADHHQVLCITHLPQIASYADRHLTVRKEQTGSETRTSVRAVDDGERIQELAEMIGGQHITDTTRAQARELLETAQATPTRRGKAEPPPASPAAAAKPAARPRGTRAAKRG
jgi:DNA repair protein RecN (Recombination protein N)